MQRTVVSGFFVSLGMDNQQATVNGLPLCCDVAPNATEAGRAMNRRAEVVVSVASPSPAFSTKR